MCTRDGAVAVAGVIDVATYHPLLQVKPKATIEPYVVLP